MRLLYFLIFVFLAPSTYAGNSSTLKDLPISFKTESIKEKHLLIDHKTPRIKVEIRQAIQIAIKSFKNDFDEGNQTPLDLIVDESYENNAMNVATQGDATLLAKSQLERLLLEKGTHLVLVNNKRVGEDLGFNPFKKWVFELKIKGIRGFTFWCVVSKYSDEETFTFGEN
jgi:hypothetical protein